MQTIETRILEAEALWRRGDALVDTADGAAAYAVYTQAHDLIMDCPSLHERAHRKLQRVSARHGHRGELIIDTRSEEHTSELATPMSISYAALCLHHKTT